MEDNKDIGDVAGESDAEESCEPCHIGYDINADKYFRIKDGKRERILVKRYKGHFNKYNRFIVESVSEPR